MQPLSSDIPSLGGTVLSARARLLGYLIVLLIAAIPIFGHLDELPIIFFDEQRLATNALEMKNSGNLLLTTYDGKPDYSNTKPPLLIWLQAASMQIIGTNELAIRLPSALAALATCLLLYAFCVRRFGSSLMGICSVLVLCTAQGYIEIHGTRTGDYDALLTLFTTAYCLAWFDYLEDGKTRQLYSFFVFAMLAVMTKCTEACLMLPALAIYTFWKRAVTATLSNIHFWIGLLILVLPVASWYVSRSQIDPGYLDAVWKMDVGGRYSTEMGVIASPDFYLVMLAKERFVPWLEVAVAGIIIGLLSARKEVHRLVVFLVLAGGGFIAVISFSVTKFYWYLMPAYPLLSLLAAIALWLTITSLSSVATRNPWYYHTVVITSVALIFIRPYLDVLDKSINPTLSPGNRENGQMGFFMKDVLHGRRSLNGAAVAIETYQGNIRWYFRVLASQGHPVTTIEDRKFAPGQQVIAYQDDLKEYIDSHFETRLLEDFRGVHVYQIIRPKSA